VEASSLEELKPIVKAVRLLENMPNPPKLSPFLNRRIDELLHKAAERDKRLWLVDSLAHTVAEMMDSIALSMAKSARYNLRRLVEGGGREG
jgi:hypothetical protein